MTPEEKAYVKEYLFKQIAPLIDRTSGYAMVSRSDALDFMGFDDESFFNFLVNDPIRNQHPTNVAKGQWFYYWNVVDAEMDFLQNTEIGKDISNKILYAYRNAKWEEVR